MECQWIIIIVSENGEGNLDKEATSYDDIFDGYRLALKYYQIKSQ